MTVKEAGWLAHVRTLPCLICRKPVSIAHHLLRTGEHAMGKRSPHRYAVPLCDAHHRELHELGDEHRFFFRYGVNAYVWVRETYQRWHDPKRGPTDE